jgi:hypothetical protein
MAKNYLKVAKLFVETMEKIYENIPDQFCGIGLLLYDSRKFSHKYHSDLRPSFSYPNGIKLGSEDCIKFLREVANYSSPLHDGFIFFNEKGLMTHVSQYFAPLINDKKIVPNESYGTRYRAAQYGSLLKGVILTGIIPHDASRYIIFWKGREIDTKELEKIYSSKESVFSEYLKELKVLIKSIFTL